MGKQRSRKTRASKVILQEHIESDPPGGDDDPGDESDDQAEDSSDNGKWA